MKVIRSELSASAVSPVNLRYDATCDCIQQTPDNGTTWVDVPEADPRHAEGFRKPPLSGMDAKCDAAAREVAAWREVYDLFISSTSAAQFATIILNILLVLAGGAGVLIALLFLLFDALIFIGKEEMEAAFDDDVWDAIMCIIYCHIGEDGSVSAEELDAIYADILALYPGTIYNTLIEIGHLFGEVLLSNASVERTETGDCDECGCSWCYHFDAANQMADWTPEYWNACPGTPLPAWDGSRWNRAQITIDGCNGHQVTYVRLRWDLAEAVTFTDAAVYGTTPRPVNYQIYVNGDGSLFSGTLVWNNESGWIGAPQDVTTIEILCFAVDSTTAFYIDAAQFSGVGDNPFGENNC